MLKFMETLFVKLLSRTPVCTICIMQKSPWSRGVLAEEPFGRKRVSAEAKSEVNTSLIISY